MERHKISKLLNDSTVSNFVTRKWIKLTDQVVNTANKNILLRLLC